MLEVSVLPSVLQCAMRHRKEARQDSSCAIEPMGHLTTFAFHMTLWLEIWLL